MKNGQQDKDEYDVSFKLNQSQEPHPNESNGNQLDQEFLAILLTATPSQLAKIEEDLRKEYEEEKAEKEKRERIFVIADQLKNADREQMRVVTRVTEALVIQTRLERYTENRTLTLLQSLAESVEDGTTIWEVHDALVQGDPITKEVILKHALDQMTLL
jgi:hypothetical protein